ncbi:FixH family protein [Phaeodactylibacter luteus]|uniref:Nitrogen fixation protein FixH n=1 Tax=Phaeodactylibacter luteus TaxID=1564516 RepID=A0A5C6RID4_9BACT|nr:FixH family protein [Phaeodactylibacter luteus]TXB60114.1 nitrogen fixation protein FixH [Phaeodactylibacter luteus]
MKINWGTGIAIFFSVFVLSLVYQVYRSTQYDHSLVSDQYYADDLRYQEHYDKLANAQSLEKDLQIRQPKPGETIEIAFPAQAGEAKGEIYFFCPADKSADFRLPVKPMGDGVQRVPVEGLRPGLWKVKVDWEAGGKSYYKEQDIRL